MRGHGGREAAESRTPPATSSGFEEASHRVDDGFHAVESQLRIEGQGERFVTRPFGFDQRGSRRIRGERRLLVQSARIENCTRDSFALERF